VKEGRAWRKEVKEGRKRDEVKEGKKGVKEGRKELR
jgi:hypothetical protein